MYKLTNEEKAKLSAALCLRQCADMYKLTNEEETELQEMINGMNEARKLFVFSELAEFIAKDFRAESSEKKRIELTRELTNEEKTRLRKTINEMTTDQKLFVVSKLVKFVENNTMFSRHAWVVTLLRQRRYAVCYAACMAELERRKNVNRKEK